MKHPVWHCGCHHLVFWNRSYLDEIVVLGRIPVNKGAMCLDPTPHSSSLKKFIKIWIIYRTYKITKLFNEWISVNPYDFMFNPLGLFVKWATVKDAKASFLPLVPRLWQRCEANKLVVGGERRFWKKKKNRCCLFVLLTNDNNELQTANGGV